jgi:hypothetical protein
MVVVTYSKPDLNIVIVVGSSSNLDRLIYVKNLNIKILGPRKEKQTGLEHNGSTKLAEIYKLK